MVIVLKVHRLLLRSRMHKKRRIYTNSLTYGLGYLFHDSLEKKKNSFYSLELYSQQQK